MKSSLGKLRKFALHKSDGKEKKDQLGLAHLDGLAQAYEDIRDMKNCYDSLLSAAALMANSAYEFSESLLEMGNCLLERTGCNDEGQSGTSLSLLGRVQLQLQKLVDNYRSHIISTITNPSESLLSELRKVEEMKLQCDEKREMYEYLVAQQSEKGRSKTGRGESLTSEQLQAAREEYDEIARLCIFRVESLKQGQCRSLLTQASRHHAAQLNFFRKGLKSLEAVEPHIRDAAQKQHIDFHLGGLDDDEDGGNSSETNDDGELSFDYRRTKLEPDNACPSRSSMELDQVDPPTTHTPGMEHREANFGKNQDEPLFNRQPRAGSHSAPIYADKFDPAERSSDRVRETQSSLRKFHTYALPTPDDARSSTSRMGSSVYQSSTTSFSGGSNSLWHSSPLDTEKHRKFTDDNLPVGSIIKSQPKLKEINASNPSIPLPTPLPDGSPAQADSRNGFDTKKVKRQAFSGPLASSSSTGKSLMSSSGPIAPNELPQLNPGFLSRVSVPQAPSSLNVSHNASPPLVSSPRISELHELPRPPGSFASKPASSSGLIGHSAPLVNRNAEVSPTNKSSIQASHAGSPLPPPPLTVPRSFSIPSSNQRAMAVHMGKLLESPRGRDKKEEIASPPLTPITLSNLMPLSSVSELSSKSGKIRVDAGGS